MQHQNMAAIEFSFCVIDSLPVLYLYNLKSCLFYVLGLKCWYCVCACVVKEMETWTEIDSVSIQAQKHKFVCLSGINTSPILL